MTFTDSRGRTVAPIGPVVRVQVQRESLKRGDRPQQVYDPAPLVAVAALALTPSGVVGHDDTGNTVRDVHNAAHPATKYRGENGISVGFTAHYTSMRDRFGSHLADGIAAENILVQTDIVQSLDDVVAGFVIVTRSGREIALGAVEVAEPCAPFSRFCLHLPPDSPADARLTETLRFLRGGTRGFYATLEGNAAGDGTGELPTVSPGDMLYRVLPETAGQA